jgi:signal transduction histidine kinase
MTNLLAIISRSLAAKLIIALLSLIIVGVGISWYALIHRGRENLVREAVKDAAAHSAFMKKGIRYDMLTFDRQAIQGTLDDMRSAQDVNGIKLFNSSGRIVYSSLTEEIGRQADRTFRACKGCHAAGNNPSRTLTGTDQWTTARGADGYNVLTFVDPIYNEPTCWQAVCHFHLPTQRVLGILDSEFSLAAVDKSIHEQTVSTTVYALVLMSVISMILYLVLRKFVLTPLLTLSSAMGQVSHGHLGRTVTTASQDEVGTLVRSFNDMTQELKTARERMEHWTESLEQEVAIKTAELRSSQDKLIHAEKLAALGRLTAEVAHEIRNPLTAIGGFARRLRKGAGSDKERERAEIIVTEVSRLEKILRDVLTFSRDARNNLEKHLLEGLVSEVLSMYEHACSEQSVDVEVVIEKDLPPVLIDRDQIRQAFINLVANALDAMPNGGALKISAGNESLYDVRYVYLSVSDTGDGIDDDKMRLIFEPFFTTKEKGRGTGLGLSLSRKIIEEHGGFIRVESVIGKGSVFSLYFPLQDDGESGEIKCWEYKKCGRDKDASAKCPAYMNFGRICWAVAGTFCAGKVQGTFAQKYEDCRKCDFYQMVKNQREENP